MEHQEKNIQSKRIAKTVICVVLLCVIGGISIGTGFTTTTADVAAMIHINAQAIVKVIIMILFVLVIANIIQLILQSLKFQSKRGKTIVTILDSLIQYAAAIVIICWGLTLLGMNISTVFASIGLLALIVGFGAESLIEDVITGIFMLFENQYNVGDIIEVGGFRGTVQRIGIRTTIVTDAGNNQKIINNSEMKNILNRSSVTSRSFCDIAISYDTDLEKLESNLSAILSDIAGKHEDLFEEIPEYLGVQELESSAIVLRFSVKVDEKDIFATNRILNHDLLLAFQKNGVSIPYTQIDIHTR